MDSPERHILHVDMDAFFAAIAVLDDPSLKGKPVLTGGTGPRGVVTTASYEARKFGCHSAMPMAVARRLCPQALCVKVPGQRIRECSAALFDTLDHFSPLVQPLSVDEAFLDVTGSLRLLGSPTDIAQQIKERIHKDIGLTASVGVAPNKFLAKLASGLNKPDGLTVITPDNLDDTLLPLPISKMWGVGPALEEKLAKLNVRTFADARQLTEGEIRHLGDDGSRLSRLSRGLDDRPVTPDRDAKSIGHEQTFSQNLQDPDAVRDVILHQAEAVARRCRRKSRLARGVTVKIRFGSFQTITRSTTLDRPSELTHDLHAAALQLFNKWAASSFSPVRLIGVTAYPLTTEPQQLDLIPDPALEKRRRLDTILDAITSRFGESTIHRGNPHSARSDPANKPA
ncbi:MAG: DNA polymerase IV [Planctomycetota bacterium]